MFLLNMHTLKRDIQIYIISRHPLFTHEVNESEVDMGVGLSRDGRAPEGIAMPAPAPVCQRDHGPKARRGVGFGA